MYSLWEKYQQELLVLCLLLLIGLFFFHLIRAIRDSWRRGKAAMSSKQKRAKYRNEIMADIITDGLLTQLIEGKLTKKECIRLARRMAHSGNLYDLMPGRIKFVNFKDYVLGKRNKFYPKPDQLKGEIDDRLKKMNWTPVKLPDDNRPDNPIQAILTNRISGD